MSTIENKSVFLKGIRAIVSVEAIFLGILAVSAGEFLKACAGLFQVISVAYIGTTAVVVNRKSELPAKDILIGLAFFLSVFKALLSVSYSLQQEVCRLFAFFVQPCRYGSIINGFRDVVKCVPFVCETVDFSF